MLLTTQSYRRVVVKRIWDWELEEMREESVSQSVGYTYYWFYSYRTYLLLIKTLFYL